MSYVISIMRAMHGPRLGSALAKREQGGHGASFREALIWAESTFSIRRRIFAQRGHSEEGSRHAPWPLREGATPFAGRRGRLPEGSRGVGFRMAGGRRASAREQVASSGI